MIPLILAGAIWGFNAVKIAQLRSRNNSLRKRDEDEENKSLTIFKDCTFEDKRTYNFYENCTINYYIIKTGKDD